MKVVAIDALYGLGLGELDRDSFDAQASRIDDLAIEITKYASEGLLLPSIYGRLADQSSALRLERDTILNAENFDVNRAANFLTRLNMFKTVSDAQLADARAAKKNRTLNMLLLGGASALLFGAVAFFIVFKNKK